MSNESRWIKFGGNFSRNIIPNCMVKFERDENNLVKFFHDSKEISENEAQQIIKQYNEDLIEGTFEQKILKSASDEFDAFCIELEGAKFVTIGGSNFSGGSCNCCEMISATEKVVAYKKLS